MNLPNKLSLSRIFAVPFILVLMLPDRILFVEDPIVLGVLRMAALVLVICVAITDWLDGKIAREQQLVTNLGKLLDPLADKIFVTAVLVGLVELQIIPAWAVVIIVAREFLVTGLRMLAIESGRLIAADRLGKHKTGWQLALIISGILLLGLGNLLMPAYGDNAQFVQWFGWIVNAINWFILAVALALTIASGWNYLRRNMDLLANN